MKKTVYLLIALSFVIGITIGSSTHVTAQQTSIPSWVKNTALWWGQGQISDAQFISALQYLINQGIITIPSTQSTTNNNQQSSNQLENYMPASSDLSSAWKILPPNNSKWAQSYGASISTEQIFQNTLTNDVVTVDMGKYSTQNIARSQYTTIITHFVGSYGFEQWAYTVPNSNISCSGQVRTTGQSTDIDLLCTTGNLIFLIDTNGQGIGIGDATDQFASIIIGKMPNS